MKMIFEDYKEVNISKILKYAYSEDECNSVIDFTGGNGKVLDYLENSSEDVIIAFVDIVPDNIKTIGVYKKCKKYSKESGKQIFVIPIPCIEYYAVKALLRSDDVDNAVAEVYNYDKYRLVKYNYRNRKLSLKSFEKYCKSVLYNYSSCLDVNGKFYKVDCKCSKPLNLGICNDKTRIYKAWSIIHKLPTFIVSKRDTVQTMLQRSNIFDVIEKQEKLYYDAAYRFLENGYISKIESLDYESIDESYEF